MHLHPAISCYVHFLLTAKGRKTIAGVLVSDTIQAGGNCMWLYSSTWFDSAKLNKWLRKKDWWAAHLWVLLKLPKCIAPVSMMHLMWHELCRGAAYGGASGKSVLRSSECTSHGGGALLPVAWRQIWCILAIWTGIDGILPMCGGMWCIFQYVLYGFHPPITRNP